AEKIVTLTIGDEDYHAVALLARGQNLFACSECSTDFGAVEPRWYILGSHERRSAADCRDVGRERAPVHDAITKEGQPKGVALAVGAEFIDCFHGRVVATAVAKRCGHAVGNIDAQLDIG